MGIACHRFLSRSDRNSGFHSNRQLPLSYNGENVVATLEASFLTGSSSFLGITRPTIRSRMSSNFGQVRPQIAELAALERLEKSP